MAVKAVIFDFDGTVADTNQLVIDSWQHTYKTVKGELHPVEKIVKTFGEPLRESMRKAFPERDTDEVVEIYRDYQLNRDHRELQLFPGIRELLEGLRDRGYKVGIVTSRTKDTTLRGLRRFGIEGLIDSLVTCNDTTKHKPDPEPALIGLQELDVKADEAVFVGDTMFDMGCAHNAGIKAVMVGWTLSVDQEEMSGDDGPEYIIEKADDLYEVLKSC
jgi:pyrophosphatase PpaX